jgi:hypothetical protein
MDPNALIRLSYIFFVSRQKIVRNASSCGARVSALQQIRSGRARLSLSSGGTAALARPIVAVQETDTFLPLFAFVRPIPARNVG